MICGVLLAAGAGLRFGSNKLYHPLPDGTPMAVKAARTLVTVLPHSVAVVRPEERRLARLLADEGLKIVPCSHAVRGMGASLACGVRATPQCDGWLIALADMPFIHRETLSALAGALNEDALLTVPEYRGRRGHPVGFHRDFREHLTGLDGDQGARRILEQNPQQLYRLTVDDPGILADIDNHADLSRCSNACAIDNC